MFRPMIYAPMRSPKRFAKSLSGPVVPPVCPCISRNARVPTYQPCSSSPPTPSPCSSPWRGPAPYPSSEIAKLWTRSLDMESSAGFICVEWAVPKSTGEGCTPGLTRGATGGCGSAGEDARELGASVNRTPEEHDEIDDDRRYQHSHRGNQDPRRDVAVRGDQEIPAPNRDHDGDAGPQSRLEGVDAFVGSQVEPSGHEHDDGQPDGRKRCQPRQHAGRHRQYQTGGAEHLSHADEDHHRTG